MILCSTVFLTIGLVVASPTPDLYPLSDEYINEINNKQSLWTAGRNWKIEDYELFKINTSGVIRRTTPKKYAKVHDENENVPESFDSRVAWPECSEFISIIRDQSKCGSCWAFGAVNAMTSRICIHSKGTKQVMVSAQNILTCGGYAGSCHGGFPDMAWKFWQTSGIVSGGLFNRTDQGCQSYFLPPCEDHLNKCTDYGEAPSCSNICDDSTLDYEKQKTYGKKLVELTGERQIQLEIIKNGPVVGVFDIFPDFATYKNGIYKATSKDPKEYITSHAIEIIGWGVENGVKYWHIVNSWGPIWGENGFFRILRGEDEVGIESEITAALPDLSRF